MVKKIKRKTRFIINLIMFLLLIAASTAFGAFANDEYGWTKNSISLKDYIEGGHFHGVKVHTYDGYDRFLEGKGYERNFTEPIGGFYSTVDDTIYINTADRFTNYGLIKNLFHEYGHRIWYKVLTEEEREEFKEIYLENEYFVSEYAITDGLAEDFAETYKAYMVGDTEIPREKLSFFYRISKAYPLDV